MLIASTLISITLFASFFPFAASFAGLITLPAVGFRICLRAIHCPRTYKLASGDGCDDCSVHNEDYQVKFHELCDLVNPLGKNSNPEAPTKRLVRLDESSDRIRGLYLNRNLEKGSILLSIPLSHCLRDDQPPQWFESDQENDIVDVIPQDDNEWAVRLAASVLDLQLRLLSEQDNSCKREESIWFSLFPDSAHLRASLPVHWSEEVVTTTKCTQLELAVDSSFFARAQARQELLDRLENDEIASELEPTSLADMVEYALDLVQTRSCRVVLSPGAANEKPIRLMAPVFDFINHDSVNVNAKFGLAESMSGELFFRVHTLKDMAMNEEVLIDYGNSAWPDWRCLLSYGFVPFFQPGMPTQADDENYELSSQLTAEVEFYGQRYQVGPDSVPEDLNGAVAVRDAKQEEQDSEEIVLTPQIARTLAEMIQDAAVSRLDEAGRDWEKRPIDQQLAASLRGNQQRILTACYKGLREWADHQQQP